ncbi:MAG: T9SS type A sorting domain-containing protein [Ignavibacteriales bacterium]|nr:T9SS type A sorting domain-containing protein [Ignavibacteriales bacterium]
MGFVNGNGTSTETHTYSFTDQNPVPGKSYYKLKQIDFDGSFEYSNIVEVDLTLPIEFSLEQNYPNPFNPATSIQYTISSKQNVQLLVYNVLGKEIATLVNEEKPAGNYEVNFDASKLSSGVYFYQLQAGSFVETKKMILLR